jgi:O-antigen ligase
LSIKTSFNAITPKSEGWKRTLFGWGSENYQFAWAKYYNPEVYRYESAAFDRAHDKYLDIIVMYGVIGLLSYLVFLVACTRAIMRLKGLEKYILFLSSGQSLSQVPGKL